jgi:hypothetical protein
MSMGKEGERKGLLGSARSAMTSFAGVMTALAAIATAIATLLGLYVHHQAVQLQKIQVTVTQQQQQLKTLKGTSAAQASPTPTGSDPSTSGVGAPPGGTRYLSALNPTVNNGSVSTGQQVIAAQEYTSSLLFGCYGPNGDQPDEAYDVAGSSTFTAVVGIPDDASDATNVIVSVTFTNEASQRVGQPVQVSLGHPVRVRLHIAGVTQLGVSCVARDARTGQGLGNIQVALGNAQVF